MNAIKVGNAPCSWGTLEFADTQSSRLEYETVLDEVAEAGYCCCELGDWGFMPTDPTALAHAYATRKLSLTGAFVPVALREQSSHEAGLRQCLKEARLLRATAEKLDDGVEPFLVLADDNGTDTERTMNAGRVKPSMGMSDIEWDTFAEGANLVARHVHDETGIRTVFHHHCAGFIETPDEIDRLLERTDAASLGLVFDTGHYAFGAGGCAGIIDAMERYAGRIWYVHFKDFQPEVLRQSTEKGWNYFKAVANGIFCELGDGCVDFPAVLDWLKQHHYRGAVTVEQDVLPGIGSPLASAKRSRAYLASIGL